MSEQSLRLFRDACGSADELKLAITHVTKQEGYNIAHPPPFLMVGRDKQADLSLEDSQVSVRHAYLQMIEGRLWCADLDSRTGISWDEGAGRSGWLDPCRRALIGPFLLRNLADKGNTISGAGKQADPEAPIPPQQDVLPAITLEFANAAPKSASWRLNRTLTLVGRSPQCKVRLGCASVSRFHCSLLRTFQGLWVVDLMGGGGIAVNGVNKRWAHLADGDRLRVGMFSIRVRYEDSAKIISPTTRRSLPPARVEPKPPAELAPPETLRFPGPVERARGPHGQAAENALLAPALDAGFGSVEPALGPLVSQFSQMQQHMFEQFQQSMLSMVGMFSELHRDQVGLIRQELDRLHELTEELNALRGELARQAQAPAKAVVAQSPPEANKVRGPNAGLGKGYAQPPAQGAQAKGREPAVPPALGGRQRQPGDGQSVAPPDRAPAAPPADVHRWLLQRFEAIQQERQTRWQKLLAFMTGKPREAAAQRAGTTTGSPVEKKG